MAVVLYLEYIQVIMSMEESVQHMVMMAIQEVGLLIKVSIMITIKFVNQKGFENSGYDIKIIVFEVIVFEQLLTTIAMCCMCSIFILGIKSLNTVKLGTLSLYSLVLVL